MHPRLVTNTGSSPCKNGEPWETQQVIKSAANVLATSEQRPTVFIVDDDPDIRRVIAVLVRSINIHAETCASAKEFLGLYDSHTLGCVVVDMRMPETSGLELQKHLAVQGFTIPLIFLSGHGDVLIATEAIRAGAVDFLLKPFSPQRLLERISEAIALDRRYQRSRIIRTEFRRRIARLTVRQLEIMELLATGASAKEIAMLLKLSPKTVDNHRANILEKLELDNTVHLARAMVDIH